MAEKKKESDGSVERKVFLGETVGKFSKASRSSDFHRYPQRFRAINRKFE
jgi:hypothetical protein